MTPTQNKLQSEIIFIPGSFNFTSNKMKFGSNQEMLHPLLVKREQSKFEVMEQLQLIAEPIGIHLLAKSIASGRIRLVLNPDNAFSQYPANMHEDQTHLHIQNTTICSPQLQTTPLQSLYPRWYKHNSRIFRKTTAKNIQNFTFIDPR